MCQVQSITGFPDNTICDWLAKNHSLGVYMYCESWLPEDQMIVWPGVIVQVDESIFGKRKYHRVSDIVNLLSFVILHRII